MIEIESLKQKIIERLVPLRLHKIILFGSYANGEPNENSDIDIYIVTDDDFIPKNYDENNKIYMTVSRAIRDIKEEIPIDMIVHTKKMYEKFEALGSSFSREVLQKGVRLYES